MVRPPEPLRVRQIRFFLSFSAVDRKASISSGGIPRVRTASVSAIRRSASWFRARALSVGVNTHDLRAELGEHGGKIQISYAIEIEHNVAGENSFLIDVREKSPLPQ